METIVLYPPPGMSHLVAMVELGKCIHRHNPSFTITILTAPSSLNAGAIAAYISHVSATVPCINFHHLPPVSLDLLSFPSPESMVFEFISRCNAHLRGALATIARSATISAFIIDFFCASSLAIAKDLKIPTYFFMTSSACCLALFFNLPQLHRTTTESFRNIHTPLQMPGLPSIIPSSDMLTPVLDRDSGDYDNFLSIAGNMCDSDGIIVNTFETLEIKPLDALREGKCNPNRSTPPIYCVGPLLAADGGDTAHDCLQWLDRQPRKSVVFLCFGNFGLFSAAQLIEIAIGLEKSGVRFLWVVRSPPTEDPSKRYLPPQPPELDILLPAGFVERTKERGLVVKSWAPQVAVLNHEAVGGFVTHCGWNSVLEAVSAAVPMVAWPLYAEQKLNRTVLVEEMKMGIRLEVGKDGFVMAEEVERKVVQLMKEEGEMRKVVEDNSLGAKAAMAKGGSSVAAMEKLVELLKSAN